ncbi:helix-turn-helix transcriptional regulator [Lactobacillus sp. PV037]|uniref:helix-turn-helix domain-containing protein n=1 Tax=unclassified Lactobacillus TaxID=2620435 RepID=UPI0022409D28|nr:MULTISPECIES: helix-turn-helix transcriptional regulator [unclassified Lactobacillus]QNQ82328.1 helix-turn-helix transcriptional regulator [Lactobacillus sp. PV012]QNQ83560.1 helix-turn-helix transcriptional regulator [Lactobacillus sp. PV037]
MREMRIGERLKTVRLFLGLTQTEMSEGVMTESYYSKVERDISKVKIDALLTMLNRNGISLEDFFEINNPEIDKTTLDVLETSLLTLPQKDSWDLMELLFKEAEENKIDKKAEVADLAIRYLHHCYVNSWVAEGKKVIKFIERLPPYPILAIEKLCAQYYHALFEKNTKKISTIKELLTFNGYEKISKELPELNNEDRQR